MKYLVINSKYSKTLPATLALAALVFLATASNVHSGGTRYQIRRDMSTATVNATLRISAHGNKTQFVLSASGLTPLTDYLLALNGVAVQGFTADASGRLRIDSLVVPIDVLNLQSVALWDFDSNVVLSTTLN